MTDGWRRSLSGVQLCTGLATALRPRAMVAALTPRGSAVPDVRIVRVLGLRQAVQGAAGLARPTASVMAMGAVVDLLHAVSLLPIIAFSPRYRAAAAASAGLATAAAVAGLLVADRFPASTSA